MGRSYPGQLLRWAALLPVCTVLMCIGAGALAAEGQFPFDSRALVQVYTLAAFPRDVTVILGWHKSGVGGMADAGEKFNPTDVVDSKLSQRRFLFGGASPNTALVVYEQGGYSLTVHAAAFVLGKTKWTKAGEWMLPDKPRSLLAATEILDSEHYPDAAQLRVTELRSKRISKTRPARREGPLRELNLSDNEVREIQGVAFQVFPGAILSISGVVTGCPCEEGPACTDQVWVVAHTSGRVNGLQLSNVGGRWILGVVQQWWLEYQKLLESRLTDYRKWYTALEEMQNSFPACTDGSSAMQAPTPSLH